MSKTTTKQEPFRGWPVSLCEHTLQQRHLYVLSIQRNSSSMFHFDDAVVQIADPDRSWARAHGIRIISTLQRRENLPQTSSFHFFGDLVPEGILALSLKGVECHTGFTDLISASHKEQAGSLPSIFSLITRQGWAPCLRTWKGICECSIRPLGVTHGSDQPHSCGRGRKATWPTQPGQQACGSHSWDSWDVYLPGCGIPRWGTGIAGAPLLLPGFEREVSVETCPAGSQAPMTSELHCQSSLMQETDPDGGESCHSPFLQSLQLAWCCWTGWYSPSLLSVSCLYCTSPCLQFLCPHHLSSSLLPSGSFSVSGFSHLFPNTTGQFISRLC